MKYTGSLPKAVVGDIKHHVNNDLAVIFLRADLVPGEEGEAIRAAAERIAKFVAALEGRSEWNSNPFELASESQACAMYNRNDDGEAA